MQDALYSPQDVASILGVKVHTLAVWRSTKRYPLTFIKVGRRVQYRREDVEKFIAENTHRMDFPMGRSRGT